MKWTFLLCALFALASVQAPCTCNNKEDRKQLKVKLVHLMKNHKSWTKNYKSSLEKSYQDETKDLKRSIDQMMKVDYLREQLNVSKKVKIEHCLKEFKYRMKSFYEDTLRQMDARSIRYMNLTALEGIEGKLADLERAVHNLDHGCTAGNTTNSVVCLPALNTRFLKLSYELVSSQQHLAAKKILAIEYYRKSSAESLEEMKSARNYYEEGAKECIKAALEARSAK